MNIQKHNTPVDPTDRTISPCDGRLFTTTHSAQNLQICTGYLASCYLVKYVTIIDDLNQVYIGASAKDLNCILAEMQFLHGTKVTSLDIAKKCWICVEIKTSQRDGRWH